MFLFVVSGLTNKYSWHLIAVYVVLHNFYLEFLLLTAQDHSVLAKTIVKSSLTYNCLAKIIVLYMQT